MRYNPRFTLVLAFVAFSLTSAIYISVAAVNYLSLFPAIDDIKNQQLFQIDKMVLQTPGLLLQVSVSNPTSYSGLKLSKVEIAIIYFYDKSNNSDTILQPPASSPSSSQPEASPIGPDSSATVNFMIPLSTNQTSQLIAFNNAHPGRVVGHAALTIDISTFLDSVVGFYAYTRTQEALLLFS